MSYVLIHSLGEYFKYSSKGKNISMVKISRKELDDFLVPVPSLEQQKEVVNLILEKIDGQIEIKKKIGKINKEISMIIEKAIISGKSD